MIRRETVQGGHSDASRARRLEQIRKLIERARGTDNANERESALAAARHHAAAAGISWAQAEALAEPPVRVEVPTRRVDWRDALASLVALAHGVEGSWREGRGWAAVAFDGRPSAAEASARRFRACDAEVLRRGKVLVGRAREQSLGWASEDAVGAVWEMYEVSCAEALGEALAEAKRKTPPPPEPCRCDGGPAACSALRAMGGSCGCPCPGCAPFDLTAVLGASETLERMFGGQSAAAARAARVASGEASDGEEASLEEVMPLTAKLRRTHGDAAVHRLLAAANAVARKTVEKLRYKEVHLLMECQTCKDSSAREAELRRQLEQEREARAGADRLATEMQARARTAIEQKEAASRAEAQARQEAAEHKRAREKDAADLTALREQVAQLEEQAGIDQETISALLEGASRGANRPAPASADSGVLREGDGDAVRDLVRDKIAEARAAGGVAQCEVHGPVRDDMCAACHEAARISAESAAEALRAAQAGGAS